jgi:flagellar motor switch/type III secretory pathway protein FliN
MLEAGTHNFIAAKYLPSRMTLKDPRNMTKGQILELLAHVEEREKTYGIKEGFRFDRYCKGTDMVASAFPVEVEAPSEQAAGVTGKKTRAAKKTRKGKERALPPGTHSDTEARQTDAAGHVSVTRQSHAAGQVSRHAGNVIRQDANIDPALLSVDPVPPHSSDEEEAPGPSIRRIGDVEMTVLIKLGHSPMVPINGPSDGLPEYEVTSAAYDSCMSKLRSQQKEQVPGSRGRPRKTPKIAEDSQGLADSMTTRSRAKKGVDAVKKETQSRTRRSTRQNK